MELYNHIWTQSLSKVTVRHPLIKQLHQCRVMSDNMHTRLLNCHILASSLLSIFTQIWLWIPWVVTCICYPNLHLHVLLILRIALSWVLLFQTLNLLWMRVKPSMELMLHNQPTLSFMISMIGNLNINLQWRMISFYPCLLCFFLTSSVILLSTIFLVRHPLLVIHRTD